MTTTYAELVVPRTAEQIAASILQRLTDADFPVTDWEDGGVARTLVEMDAAELLVLENKLANIGKGGFLTAGGEEAWIELVARDFYKVDRYPATTAKFDITLLCAEGAGPYTIGAGEYWFADDQGHRYFNTTGGTLVSSLVIRIEAESPGTDYNVLVGSILNMVTPIPGVSCSNTSTATIPGTNQETIALLIQRCQDKWSTIGYGQNDDWYRYYCRNGHPYAASVTRVKVSTNPGGVAGLVGITIAGPTGTVGDSVVTAVQSSLDAKKGNCTTVSVAKATETNVNVTATCYVDPAYESSYETAASVAINELLASLDIGGTLYKAALIQKLMNVPGAQNVVVSAPSGDVTAGASAVLIAGAVIISIGGT